MPKTPENKPAKQGRPSAFNDRLVLSILEFAKTGATDAQIAEKFGIAESTLYSWKGKHTSFAEALKEAKDVADDLVEMSLFKRAVGFQHPDLHFSAYEGYVTTTPFTKVHAPDTTACIFWLKNRRPELWRDVHKIEADVKHSAVLPTREEALQALREDYAVTPAIEGVKDEELA